MLGFKQGYSIVRIAFLNIATTRCMEDGFKRARLVQGSEGNEWMEMKWKHERMEMPRFKNIWK